MSIETSRSTDSDLALPDHITIGLSDETTRNIDTYVADTNDRLDEAVASGTGFMETPQDIEALATEKILETVASTVADAFDDPDVIDSDEMKREFRRRQIIAEQHRKRRFARPILHFDAIQYPRH